MQFMHFICFLRGINVSGHRKLPMDDLLDIAKGLGCTDVVSYLQSGNIVLTTKLPRKVLEEDLANSICARFGYTDVDVIAWTGPELAEAIAALPVAWKSHDTAALHFSFLKDDVAPASGRGLQLDEYVVGKNVVYVYCPNGYGRTKLNNAFFEKLLGTRATTRNWNTANKLLTLVSS